MKNLIKIMMNMSHSNNLLKVLNLDWDLIMNKKKSNNKKAKRILIHYFKKLSRYIKSMENKKLIKKLNR